MSLKLFRVKTVGILPRSVNCPYTRRCSLGTEVHYFVPFFAFLKICLSLTEQGFNACRAFISLQIPVAKQSIRLFVCLFVYLFVFALDKLATFYCDP